MAVVHGGPGAPGEMSTVALGSRLSESDYRAAEVATQNFSYGPPSPGGRELEGGGICENSLAGYHSLAAAF
jgi:hypothetical protein